MASLLHPRRCFDPLWHAFAFVSQILNNGFKILYSPLKVRILFSTGILKLAREYLRELNHVIPYVLRPCKPTDVIMSCLCFCFRTLISSYKSHSCLWRPCNVALNNWQSYQPGHFLSQIKEDLIKTVLYKTKHGLWVLNY